MRQSRGFQVRREEGRESSRDWQREINVVNERLKEQSNILENASFPPNHAQMFWIILISVRLINRWDQDVFSLALHGAWKPTQPLHWIDAQKETVCNSFEAQNVTSNLLLHYLSVHILCVEYLRTYRQNRLKESIVKFNLKRQVSGSYCSSSGDNERRIIPEHVQYSWHVRL